MQLRARLSQGFSIVALWGLNFDAASHLLTAASYADGVLPSLMPAHLKRYLVSVSSFSELL